MGHHLAEYGALEPDPEDSGRLVAGHYLHMAGTNGRLEGLAELARVYAYIGATEQALALTADALAAVDAVRGPSVAIDVLLALVATERLVGRWPEAREHAQRALALCRESGDEPRHARACAHLGSMLALATRPDEGRAAALEGVAIARRLRLAVIEAHCHVALGRAELAAERPTEARAHLEPACACFKHSRHVVALTDALPSFFSACLRSGDIETATALMGELDALVPHFEGLVTWYLTTRAAARLSADQLDAAAHEAGRLRAAGEALEHPWATAEADRIDAAVQAAQTS
jgi:tetratricopeptide (TPR) repeat protein